MATRSFRGFGSRCLSLFFNPAFTFYASSPRPIPFQEPIIASCSSSNSWWAFRNLTIFRHYGSSPSNSSSVRCVLSQGKPKFEIYEIDSPKKYKWQTKKRLKLKRKKEKQKRRAANKKDPRRLTVKGSKTKGKFANAEERIKYKLEKVSILAQHLGIVP